MELKTSIEELKQSLLESEAFLRYQKVRAEVHNYPEKEYRLHEFRRKNYFLQNSREQLDLFTEEDRLEQEYADVYKDPLLGEYLAAEVAVCRIIQHLPVPLIALGNNTDTGLCEITCISGRKHSSSFRGILDKNYQISIDCRYIQRPPHPGTLQIFPRRIYHAVIDKLYRLCFMIFQFFMIQNLT